MGNLCIDVYGDLGASQLKGIYELKGKKPCGLSLFPNVLEVNSSVVDSYRHPLLPISEDFAWLALKSNAEKVMVVDQLAEKIFSCINHHQLKVNSAHWRILAMLGKIIALEDLLTNNPIDLNLTVLLPFGEFKQDDIRVFKSDLSKKLKKFYHNDKKIEVNLQKIKVLPEGIGSLMCSSNRDRIVVVMLGHRNTSYLIFENDKFIDGKSIQLGFSLLVEEFCQKTSGQEDNHLTTVTLWKSRLNNNQLKRISKTTRPELQSHELKTLQKAFEQTTEELWSKIKQWLIKELEETEFDLMQFTGGVAEFLKPLIKKDEKFGHLPLEFAGEQYQEKIKNSLEFPGLREENIEELSGRLVDCYGAFLCRI